MRGTQGGRRPAGRREAAAGDAMECKECPGIPYSMPPSRAAAIASLMRAVACRAPRMAFVQSCVSRAEGAVGRAKKSATRRRRGSAETTGPPRPPPHAFPVHSPAQI